MTRLAFASAETIARRVALMATGKCSQAEYRRMAVEKVEASRASVTALFAGRGHAAVLAPFLRRAGANAKRLRRQS